MNTKILLVIAHPDDETFFRGLIPLSSKKCTVDVLIVASGGQEHRDLEMKNACKIYGLSGLIHFLHFKDFFPSTLEEVYKEWNKKYFFKTIHNTIKKIKPSIIITHDLNGEYGHPNHIAVAEAIITIKNVKKIYLHKYQNIEFDWNIQVPTTEKTALMIGNEGLKEHTSQYSGIPNEPIPNGNLDTLSGTFLGLYYSSVGNDTGTNLLENI